MNNGGFMVKWISFLAILVMGAWTYQVWGQPAPLPEDASLATIFETVVLLFSNSKGISYQYKIASGLFILVALVKNSAMAPFWDRLGKLKPLVAPVLSLIAFLFLAQPFTVETALAAVTTGAAAGFFAQILDALKIVPSIGGILSFASAVVGKLLKKP